MRFGQRGCSFPPSSCDRPLVAKGTRYASLPLTELGHHPCDYLPAAIRQVHLPSSCRGAIAKAPNTHLLPLHLSGPELIE